MINKYYSNTHPVTEIMQIRDKPYKKLQSMEFQFFLIKIQDIYK